MILNDPMLSDPLQRRLDVAWFWWMRWGAVIGQALAIAVSQVVLQLVLPLYPLSILLLLIVVMNIVLYFWMKYHDWLPEWVVFGVLAIDIIFLTVMLRLSGGPCNPFRFLYLIHMAMAAVMLNCWWIWALVLLSACSFAFVYIDYHPFKLANGEILQRLPHGIESLGEVIAFILAASFIVYFLQRRTAAVQALNVEMKRVRDRQNRQEKLVSLATLAAGAAHELATPLATIAVVSKELEHHLQKCQMSLEVVQDAQLIRQQVERCRLVLSRMTADAADGAGELLVVCSAWQLMQEAKSMLGGNHDVHWLSQDTAQTMMLYVPKNSLAQVLASVVKNACEASSDGKAVKIWSELLEEGSRVAIVVEDEGTGVPDTILHRLSEPFFTTKGEGKGMGLGLFIARALCERLGGDLVVKPRSLQGTQVVLKLPLVKDTV